MSEAEEPGASPHCLAAAQQLFQPQEKKRLQQEFLLEGPDQVAACYRQERTVQRVNVQRSGQASSEEHRRAHYRRQSHRP